MIFETFRRNGVTVFCNLKRDKVVLKGVNNGVIHEIGLIFLKFKQKKLVVKIYAILTSFGVVVPKFVDVNLLNRNTIERSLK